MRVDPKLFTELLKGFVQTLIHPWWTADPDLFDVSGMWRKVIINEFLIPDLASETIPAFTDAHGKLEISFTEFTINLLQGFTDIQANLTVHAQHRYEEKELEVVLQLVHMLWHLRWFNVVLVVSTEQQVRNQVEENEHTSACTESDVDATLFDAETFAHGSLDIKDVERLLLQREMTVSADQVLGVDVFQD